MADSNPVDVFVQVQSAAVQEIHDAVGSDGHYATAFRDPASVDAGPHVNSSEPSGFSDAQEESLTFFADRKAQEQAAINDGRNGVVNSGYVNYANDTGA